jgi:phosphatidylserine/phosphatidylglycerophosphate/cardiolipin synthase-like enzyme
MPTRRRARRLVRNHMPEAFRAVMLSAQHEVLITNAYVIPDATFMDDLRDLAARGVKGAHPDQFAGVARCAGRECSHYEALAPA